MFPEQQVCGKYNWWYSGGKSLFPSLCHQWAFKTYLLIMGYLAVLLSLLQLECFYIVTFNVFSFPLQIVLFSVSMLSFKQWDENQNISWPLSGHFLDQPGAGWLRWAFTLLTQPMLCLPAEVWAADLAKSPGGKEEAEAEVGGAHMLI